MSEQATEKQINYINILKEQAAGHLSQEWSTNFFASQYQKALKGEIGEDAFYDLDDIWAYWPKYRDAAIARIEAISTDELTKKSASEMIDKLKGPGNFVY